VKLREKGGQRSRRRQILGVVRSKLQLGSSHLKLSLFYMFYDSFYIKFIILTGKIRL